MPKGLSIMILQKMRGKRDGKEMPMPDEGDAPDTEEEMRGLSLDSDEAKAVLGDDPKEGDDATFYVSGTITSVGEDGSADVEVNEVSKQISNEQSEDKSAQETKTVKVNPAPLPS